MELNKEKSKILFIKSKPKSEKQDLDIPKNIENIKVVKQAKYLGIIIDKNLRFQ